MHAREPNTAPIGIEAHHDAHCVVIHDAMSCVLCQFAASRAAPEPERVATAPTVIVEAQTPRLALVAPTRRSFATAPSRAPPRISA